MSQNFQYYKKTLKKVYSSLNTTPHLLDKKDLEDLEDLTKKIVVNAKNDLAKNGWKQEEIKNLEEKSGLFKNKIFLC